MNFTNKSLPYPLFDSADESRDDYICDYGYKAEISELSLDASKDEVSLTVKHDCEIEELSKLEQDDQALYAVQISSVITNTMRVLVSENGSTQKNRLRASDFYGRVEITPMLIASKNISTYQSKLLNEEYSDLTFELHPGDVLAVGTKIERIFEFSGASFESLVKAVLATNLEDNAYQIDVDGNFIRILMGKKIFDAWNNLKEINNARPLLAMSIYKDCFLIALDEYAKNEEARDRKWAYALKRKIDELPIKVVMDKDTSLNDLNTYAQLILEPEGAAKLSNVIESGV